MALIFLQKQNVSSNTLIRRSTTAEIVRDGLSKMKDSKLCDMPKMTHLIEISVLLFFPFGATQQKPRMSGPLLKQTFLCFYINNIAIIKRSKEVQCVKMFAKLIKHTFSAMQKKTHLLHRHGKDMQNT